MIFFVVFQKVNYRKVMTGTVWDPVITGTPMKLHKHVLRFWKIQNLHVVCDHLQRLLSV